MSHEAPATKADRPAPKVGERHTLTIVRMAHGGEGIATLDGRVVFVRGAYPGDEVNVELRQVKKNFARGEIVEILTASPDRVPQRCPATAAGAGCTDFGDLDPRREAPLKRQILADQLSRMARGVSLPPIEVIDLAPADGWRTRVRLGVDADGRAGFRAARSNEIITGFPSSQIPEDLCADILCPEGRRFQPGAELIIVGDSEGQRHIVESKKGGRGTRVEKVDDVIEGSGIAVQRVLGRTFHVPATAFWQAHRHAAGCYSGLIRTWLYEEADDLELQGDRPVAWDLYGGVGLFVPVLGDSLGEDAHIDSVELSTAARHPQPDLDDYDVTFHNASVEKVIPRLERPDVVVLDPPRTGAGADVIRAVAKAGPEIVIHIGCDPATFARDVRQWAEEGYQPRRLTLVNAFPGTHHFEVLGLFERPQTDSR